MARYLLTRALGFVLVLWAVTVIVFALQAIIPADPARALVGPAAPAETVEAVREQLGLNDPILVQYGRFLSNLLEGDLGTSVRTRQPVLEDIWRYLPATLELVGAAVVMGALLALVLALAQTLLTRPAPVRLTMLAAGSVPVFLSAMLLVYVFWFALDWLPGAGRIGIRRFEGPKVLVPTVLLGRPEVVPSACLHCPSCSRRGACRWRLWRRRAFPERCT